MNRATQISYSTNWMGPINHRFIEKNGDDWAGGRIDISGPEYPHYGREMLLPIMRASDWYRLQDWLDDYFTEEVVTLKVLLEAYYADANPKITWFNWNEETGEYDE